MFVVTSVARVVTSKPNAMKLRLFVQTFEDGVVVYGGVDLWHVVPKRLESAIPFGKVVSHRLARQHLIIEKTIQLSIFCSPFFT